MNTQTTKVRAHVVLYLLAVLLPYRRYTAVTSDWYEAFHKLSDEHPTLFADFSWVGNESFPICIEVTNWVWEHRHSVWELTLEGKAWYQFPEEYRREALAKYKDEVSAETLTELREVAQKLKELLPSAPQLIEDPEQVQTKNYSPC